MIMKPKQFYIASLVMLMVALSFPVQIMVLYGHGWNEWSAVLAKITWLNWTVMGAFFVGSYLYFHGSRYIVYMTPVILALVALNNYLVGQFAGDFTMTQTSMATLGSGLIFAPLLMPSSRVVLRDQKRRWWRRSRRINKRVSATLNPYVGEMVHGHTFDISKSGAFVALPEATETLPKIGDTVRVSLNVNSMKKIRCEAIVVRIAEPNGRYPKGMGLKFTEMEKLHEKSFNRFLNSNDYTH